MIQKHSVANTSKPLLSKIDTPDKIGYNTLWTNERRNETGLASLGITGYQ